LPPPLAVIAATELPPPPYAAAMPLERAESDRPCVKGIGLVG